MVTSHNINLKRTWSIILAIVFAAMMVLAPFAAQRVDAATVTSTLFNESQTPANAVANDTQAVTLGMEIHTDASVGGDITAVKVYRGADVGSNDLEVFVWNDSGTELGTGSLTLPSPFTAGWYTVDLDSAVTLSTDTDYVVGYHAPTGEYSFDYAYFCPGQEFNTLPLDPTLETDCDQTSGVNGLYSYGSTPAAPTSSFNASNYWIDVEYEYSPPVPSAPTNIEVQAGNEAVGLSWDNPGIGEDLTYDVYSSTSVNGTYSLELSDVDDEYATVTGLTNGTTYYFKVDATNVNGTSAQSAATSGATPQTQTRFLWRPDINGPDNFASNDTDDVNVGVQFTVDTPAKLTGVMFWRDLSAWMESNKVYVFDSSGTEIASGVFVGEGGPFAEWVRTSIVATGGGTSVDLVPGETYTASYFADGGEYSYDTDELPDTSGLINVSLGSGVYVYGSAGTFPDQVWQNDASYGVTPELQIGTISVFGNGGTPAN